nr:MAG TPA: portal protein [Caudoviricetes sp.]
MFLIDKLKGVIQRMIGPKTLENVLHITPAISSKMKDALELWEQMYTDNSPWLDSKTQSLGLAASIASEKARTATIEMEVKVTGEGNRAEFIKKSVEKLIPLVRRNLEYGIALGSLIVKPYVIRGPKGKYTVDFNFTKATNFYPLSFSSEGEILEAAFIDVVITKEAIYRKLEYHKLEGTTLYVHNYAFKQTNNANLAPYNLTVLEGQLGEPIALKEVPTWANIAPAVEIKDANTMLFAYFRMPQANCVDINSPLGVSGFSRAVNLIKDADKQYSNLLWEFKGGQLAIDVDRTTLLPMRDPQGKELPDALPELEDRLFRRNLDLDDDLYKVFSPELRDTSILNGLNAILMRIEDVCDLSRGTLSEASYAEARTATELRILKQRSYSANCDIQKELEKTLKTTISIIDKYCDLYNIVSAGEYEVSYAWDDSIIVDKDTERQVDLLDIDKGLLSPIEYRMKWMGETENQAEKAINAINKAKIENMQAQQEMIAKTAMINTQSTEKTPQSKSAPQAEHDKRTQANASTATTKPNEKN